MLPSISIFKTNTEFIKISTEFIIEKALNAVVEKNIFTFMLSGGSTPKKIYNLLSSPPYKERFPWEKTYFFLGDERLISKNNPDSNIFMLQQTLFSSNNIKETNKILPTIELNSPEISAKNYEQSLYKFFKGQEITIDLTLLGIGADGHTASLFPEEYDNWINNDNLILHTSQPCGNLSVHRISASLKLINSSKSILLLAKGEEKINILKQIEKSIKNQTDPLHSPLTRVKPLKDYHWFIN